VVLILFSGTTVVVHVPLQVCTPDGMLMKDSYQKVGGTVYQYYPLTMHSNQWLLLLQCVESGFKHTRRFYLDMIRLSRFEQLELTQTCCRFTNHENRIWDNLKDEDVQEIRDEEQELSDTLETEMSNFQSCSIAELEVLWRKEIDKLMQLQGNNFLCFGEPLLGLGSCLWLVLYTVLSTICSVGFGLTVM
jgi:hypothetical protein